MPAIPHEQSAELTNPKGERILFSWDADKTLPVTVKCYDAIGGIDAKTNLPRFSARQFWNEMLADGFTINV